MRERRERGERKRGERACERVCGEKILCVCACELDRISMAIWMDRNFPVNFARDDSNFQRLAGGGKSTKKNEILQKVRREIQ